MVEDFAAVERRDGEEVEGGEPEVKGEELVSYAAKKAYPDERFDDGAEENVGEGSREDDFCDGAEVRAVSHGAEPVGGEQVYHGAGNGEELEFSSAENGEEEADDEAVPPQSVFCPESEVECGKALSCVVDEHSDADEEDGEGEVLESGERAEGFAAPAVP